MPGSGQGDAVNGATDFWEDLEVLTIETPENLELRLPLAGFGPRFLALVIDTLIQSVLGVVLFFIAIVFMGASMGMGQAGNASDSTVMITVLIIVVVGTMLIMVGYPLLFEVIWNGQTPGKRITGIRVVRRGGMPLGFQQVLLRNLFRLIDIMPVNWFIGLVSFFATKYQQRVGDLVAGTVVVREYSSRAPASWPGQGEANYPEAGRGVLDQRLAFVINSYFLRRHELPAHVSFEITGEVIRQLGYDPDSMRLAEREGYLGSLVYSQPGVAQ